MAYIGNIPAESYASFETETFSVSATTNYTLSHAVTNENEIRLVINGVVQQPGSGKAYTASNTTLTLTSATVSGDVMYAVYLGRALQTVNPPNASVGSAQIADSLISGKTALGATPADTDELLISDAGTLKRVDYSYLKSANTPAFLAFNGSAQTLSHNTSPKIVFDLEKFDTDNAFASNTFTVPSGKAGKYLFSWGVNYFNAGVQITAALYNLKVNNSTFVEGWQDKPAYTEDYKLGSTILDLSAGNTVDLYYYITTGNSSSSTIRSGGTSSYHTFFSGYKLIT